MKTTPLSIIINLIRTHAILDERFSGELASVHGVSLNEALLLMHLERAPLYKLTRVELAKRLHLSASTVTRMASPMEKIGLVMRELDDRDARMAYVVLTKAGIEIVGELRTTLERRSAEFFHDRWTDDEISTLSHLVSRLTANQLGNIS